MTSLIYNFPSKLLSISANSDMKESLRKIGTEIRQSTPKGMERSASYSLGSLAIGSKTVKNKLGRVPTRIVRSEGPNSGTYTVSSWNKDEIIINVTVAGNVNFWIFGN